MRSFLLRLLIFACLSGTSERLHAQLQIPVKTTEIDFTHTFFTPSNFLHKNTFALESQNRVYSLPKLFKTRDLPVFCRVEVEIEKAVSFPVKFRLGSVEHVDWLEGKGRDTYLDKQ